jgi:hypothetical protein
VVFLIAHISVFGVSCYGFALATGIAMKIHRPLAAPRTPVAARPERQDTADRDTRRRAPTGPVPAMPAEQPVHQLSTLSLDPGAQIRNGFGRGVWAAFAQAGHRPNRTGLPDRLKAGIENLSGVAMDDVRVHYNSAKPARLQALAFTQGADIHVAPGQEKHLPHETWHAGFRLKPMLQMKGVAIDDDAGLERATDRLRKAATSPNRIVHIPFAGNTSISTKTVQRMSGEEKTNGSESKNERSEGGQREEKIWEPQIDWGDAHIEAKGVPNLSQNDLRDFVDEEIDEAITEHARQWNSGQQQLHLRVERLELTVRIRYDRPSARAVIMSCIVRGPPPPMPRRVEAPMPPPMPEAVTSPATFGQQAPRRPTRMQ